MNKSPPACTECDHNHNTSICMRKRVFEPVYGIMMNDGTNTYIERRYIFPFDILFGKCGRRARFWKQQVNHWEPPKNHE